MAQQLGVRVLRQGFTGLWGCSPDSGLLRKHAWEVVAIGVLSSRAGALFVEQSSQGFGQRRAEFFREAHRIEEPRRSQEPRRMQDPRSTKEPDGIQYEPNIVQRSTKVLIKSSHLHPRADSGTAQRRVDNEPLRTLSGLTRPESPSLEAGVPFEDGAVSRARAGHFSNKSESQAQQTVEVDLGTFWSDLRVPSELTTVLFGSSDCVCAACTLRASGCFGVTQPGH